jgi:hypothetical protein
MGVITRLETITPTKARKYLDKRANNRPLSARHTARLAGAMRDGEFEVNGETLKFSNDDEMIDGQHRCQACIEAGVSFRSFVTRGLNSTTFDTIDTGKARSPADVLSKYGERNANVLAAAVGWVWRYERGVLSKGRNYSPRHPEVLATLNENPGIRDSIAKTRGCIRIFSHGLATALHYIFSQIDDEAADQFFDALGTGEGLSKSSRTTSGILLLRDRLSDNKAAKTKLPQVEIIKLTIKAWNAMRRGKVVKTLRHRSEGKGPETFPEIL